jgi:hypothetical protein
MFGDVLAVENKLFFHSRMRAIHKEITETTVFSKFSEYRLLNRTKTCTPPAYGPPLIMPYSSIQRAGKL